MKMGGGFPFCDYEHLNIVCLTPSPQVGTVEWDSVEYIVNEMEIVWTKWVLQLNKYFLNCQINWVEKIDEPPILFTSCIAAAALEISSHVVVIDRRCTIPIPLVSVSISFESFLYTLFCININLSLLQRELFSRYASLNEKKIYQN